MPDEDKLTNAQRIRLEALAQANLTLGATMEPLTPERVLDVAANYEAWILEGSRAGE